MTSDMFQFNSLNGTCQNEEIEQQYSHQAALTKLDDISKTLHGLRDELLKKTVRCHLLQVKMATMMPPSLVQSLHRTVEDCQRCRTSIDNIADGTDAGGSVPDGPEQTSEAQGEGEESMVTDQ